MLTQCECDQPGWCERHQCNKPAHFFKLCQTHSDYFKMWEQGIGPGQSEPKAPLNRRMQRRMKDFSVAVVLISHNYGQFLEEAIDSVLAQTYPPAEILVVDDCSTDQTSEVAKSYASDGVKYLYVDHGNVHQARCSGFKATDSEILCFLDADDKLPADYIETGLNEFIHYQVGLIYSDVKQFGQHNSQSNYPNQYDSDLLQRDNYIHAGSLVLREALELSRVFEKQINPIHTQGDWFLWRGVLKENWIARKQSALYSYRIHGKNWGSQMKKKSGQLGYFGYAGLMHETVTLFVPLSGREHLSKATASFLDQQSWPHDQISLILMDTSQNEEFSQTVREWISQSDYFDVRYLKFDAGFPGLADDNRREKEIAHQVRLAMARIYNRMNRLVDTSYVWILEDDVIPPDDVCCRLLNSFDPQTVSVAAPYRSRYHEGFVVWKEFGRSIMQPGTNQEVVNGNGFGCTILRASYLRNKIFTAHHEYPDFDIAFYRRLQKSGFLAKVDWSCLAHHHGAMEP